jgi:hypothetical protein
MFHDKPLSCSRNPHIIRSPASWCEPPYHYQDIRQPTTPAYATHQWKRQFKPAECHGLPLTILRTFSHPLVCGATTLPDCIETAARESVSNTVQWTKHILRQNLLGGKNAFCILLQQCMHSKIHTWNASHNIHCGKPHKGIVMTSHN